LDSPPAQIEDLSPPSFQSLYSTPESASAAASAAKARAAQTPPVFGPARSLPDDDEESLSEQEEQLRPTTLPPSYPAVSGSSPQSSSSSAASRVVADTKAALPRDTKDGPAKDLDDGEPPPPYSEGGSPIKSFTYIMASAGGPASIITQVSQNAGPPINALTAGMFGDVYDVFQGLNNI
jgi:ATP-binding cassette subfamily F protein 3